MYLLILKKREFFKQNTITFFSFKESKAEHIFEYDSAFLNELIFPPL